MRKMEVSNKEDIKLTKLLQYLGRRTPIPIDEFKDYVKLKDCSNLLKKNNIVYKHDVECSFTAKPKLKVAYAEITHLIHKYHL